MSATYKASLLKILHRLASCHQDMPNGESLYLAVSTYLHTQLITLDLSSSFDHLKFSECNPFLVLGA